MNIKLFTGLVAALTILNTVFPAADAQAVTDVTETQYNNQYEGISEDVLRLDYESWSIFNDLVNTERQAIDDLPLVDLNTLSWDNGVDNVEVYFINEGATFRNQLFFTTDDNQTQEIIFDDVASDLAIIAEDDGPLSLGQGVNLGSFEGDTFLEFYIKADGANGGNSIFRYNAEDSSDGIAHLLGYQVGDYVLLGFEDIGGGGDNDFNDVVFAVKGIVGETIPPASVPEPAAGLGLAAVGAFGFMKKKKKKKNAN